MRSHLDQPNPGKELPTFPIDLTPCLSLLESLLPGILNLASTHLGPGLLMLPYVVRICGVFGGTLFVGSGVLINVLSKRMLTYSSERTQISDYKKLIADVIGPVTPSLSTRHQCFFSDGFTGSTSAELHSILAFWSSITQSVSK